MGDWQQCSDGLFEYWWNVTTDETVWELPPEVKQLLPPERATPHGDITGNGLGLPASSYDGSSADGSTSRVDSSCNGAAASSSAPPDVRHEGMVQSSVDPAPASKEVEMYLQQVVDEKKQRDLSDLDDQVSKFKQAYEERKKAAGKSSAGSLFAFGDVAKAALESSHSAGRANLSNVATQALKALHGKPLSAPLATPPAAAPQGEIVKGAIGPRAAESPRASRYCGDSIQNRQSMFGGAWRARLSTVSELAGAASSASTPLARVSAVSTMAGAPRQNLGARSQHGASSPKTKSRGGSEAVPSKGGRKRTS